MHWYEAVAELRARRLELARIDPRGGMPIRPPVGAAEADIARVERRLARPLPPSYRALLAAQDGWPRFYLGASLLGTVPLARGTFVDVGRMVFADAEPASASDHETARRVASYVPFGIDDRAETVFAWDLAAERADGELGVVVVSNEIGVRLDDFPAFLELCVDMMRADVDARRALARRDVIAPREPSSERGSRAA